ncbi:alkane 1-monooxygenase [Roseateles sp. PN1]|uniref:alkane 1-monooxygenase n=1 Tax=Roseateles sp. PN1 TaxID=3137372 RepID=UPI003138DC4B
MPTTIAVSPPYRDPKRYAWLLSLAVPSSVLLGPGLLLLTGQVWTLWLPVLMLYGLMPLLDLALGLDTSNPPEDAVPALQADPFYRRVTYALAPILWASFVFCVWFVATHPLPWYGLLAMVIIAGSVGGFCINLGHELGHKPTALERWLAKIVLAPSGYGHFFIEHNRGHHRDVATPLDPASSRMGESIYRFVLREMPGAARRAWVLESTRLRKAGLPVWSLQNEILQPALITVALWTALVLWLGPQVLPFILATAFWANFQLTSANYIEHYGLLRAQRPDGRYEPTQPHHSWNSNHLLSNWATFHLQRHSDHHAHPLRRYQALRHFDNLPQLPNGYFGMFSVAYLPPLWFKVMDQRLLDSVGRDPQRINFEPSQRERLMRKHGLVGGA